jgi:hypothetical protein
MINQRLQLTQIRDGNKIVIKFTSFSLSNALPKYLNHKTSMV